MKVNVTARLSWEWLHWMGCAAGLMGVEEVMWVEYSNAVTKILGNLEINKKC